MCKTNDAARKARHFLASDGKVLFLTPNGNQRTRWVNSDGSLGEVLEFEDLQAALGHLVTTRPVAIGSMKKVGQCRFFPF